MHLNSIKKEAITLREKGYSYAFISEETGVSKSTLSDWLGTVPYIPNKETITHHGIARAKASKHKADRKLEELSSIREDAESDIQTVSNRDLFMYGLGLYMGEGTKTNGVIRFANSDPKVISAMVLWFMSLGVEISQFRPRIYAYPDLDTEACLQFWSQTTTIPESQFLKTWIDIRTDKKSTHQKLPFGTLHLGVSANGRKEFGVKFFRKIQMWNETVLGQLQSGISLMVEQ